MVGWNQVGRGLRWVLSCSPGRLDPMRSTVFLALAPLCLVFLACEKTNEYGEPEYEAESTSQASPASKWEEALEDFEHGRIESI